MEKQKFLVLDGLRGYAFILVLFAHVSNERKLIFSGLGQVGVWIFFILSSFLLSYYFINNSSKIQDWYEWKNYFFRRFTRIYPPFLLHIFIWILLGFYSWNNFFNIAFLNNGNGLVWTIYVEFRFYILLPLIIYLYYTLPKTLNLLLFLGYIISYLYFFPFWEREEMWRFNHFNTNVIGFKGNLLFVEYLPLFLYGVILAIIVKKHKKCGNKTLNNFLILLIVFCSILSSNVLLNYVFNLNLQQTYYHAYWFILGIPLALLVLLLFQNQSLGDLLFNNKFMRLLGKVSYSGYLFHLIIIHFTKDFVVNNHLFFFISVVLSVSLAYALYCLIEKPLISISWKAFIDKWKNIFRKKYSEPDML